MARGQYLLAATRGGVFTVEQQGKQSAIYVSSIKDDDPLPEPVIQIGEHTFADPGEYLFKIVP